MRWMLILSVISLFACEGRRPPAGTTKVEMPSSGTIEVKEDFEKDTLQWTVADGKWTKRQGVFAQTETSGLYHVALLEGYSFSDVDIAVRFRPISGNEDASGGIVFRAKDGKNYFVVRANALEDNFRLYTTIDGDRSQIAGVSVTAPKLGQWHTLRVVAVGDHIQAYLNGELLLDHHDSTFTKGRVGLWTKADSVTEFGGLVIRGKP